MSTTEIIQTKLFIPPSRPELVPRQRLVDRLRNGLHRKLTLISAPAGFGKSTLLSSWIAAAQSGSEDNGFGVAWLSLDSSDNDLIQFLNYVITAIRTVVPGFGEGTIGALRSPQPIHLDTTLTAMINQLSEHAERVVLVLDDYQHIETAEIHEALVFLVENQPQQLHLVLSSRVDPELPLARLRSQDQLTEIRASDLRFTPAETADFLNRIMVLGLSLEEVNALEKRTEGWVAGLQLAAISMQGMEDTSQFIESFTGSHRMVVDYLMEEVLERQSDDVQAFLIKTSILDRMTGGLCDALTGQSNGQEMLETLEHDNLFIIPLDKERVWYRYHHLFSDLLRDHLSRHDPDQITHLHDCARHWLEHNGMINSAIEHALRAEDVHQAARMIENQIDTVWNGGGLVLIRRWLNRLPDEVLRARPHLYVFHAYDLLIRGHKDAGDRVVQQLEQVLDPSEQQNTEAKIRRPASLEEGDKDNLRGRLGVIRALICSQNGDIPGIIHHAGSALEYLPNSELIWRGLAALALGDTQAFRGDMPASYRARREALRACQEAGETYFIIVANLKLVTTLRAQGWLRETVQLCQQQMIPAETSGLAQSHVVGCLLAIQGEAMAELNDLPGAIELVEKGVVLTERGANLGTLTHSYLCLIRVLFSMGDYARVETVLHKAAGFGLDAALPPWFTKQLAAWQARVSLAEGDLQAASRWVDESGYLPIEAVIQQEEIDYYSLFEHIVRARVLIALGQLDESLRLLNRLSEIAQATGRITNAIEICILTALAQQSRGKFHEALAALEQGLELSIPGGFIQVFLDEGEPMIRLLTMASEQGVAPDYAAELLEAASSGSQPLTEPADSGASQAELIEPLSERELEVLNLIAEGLANRDIAERLYLSLNTIKVHTRNIYGKLGVHNRTQAVARARELGLYSSS